VNREEYVASLEGLSDEKKNSLISVFDDYEKEKSIKTDVIKDRDNLKAKLKEADEKKTKELEDSQKEQGKFKELYESTNVKLTEHEKTIAELTDYKEKYTKVEADRKNELIEKLPNDDLKNLGKKFQSLDELKEFVDVSLKTFGNNKTLPVDSGRGGKVKIEVGKKWDEYSYSERAEIKKSNPEHWNKLFREKYPNQ
jgi:DNA repair exonuclease SbcCD ATPase subunit